MRGIENLPADLGRERLLDAKQTAEFACMSAVHIRRLCREGKFPRPIKIGSRKNAWRLGTLIDFNASKAGSAA